jgi:kexin
VTVSAVDHRGNHPYYSESCAANMIVAYSSGDGKHIVSREVLVATSPTDHSSGYHG